MVFSLNHFKKQQRVTGFTLHHRCAGFTLLELVVVMVAIGILAAVALPNWMDAIENAKGRDAEATLRLIFQAERMYELDQQEYGDLDNLTTQGYLTNPNPNDHWTFTIANVAATTFTATAERQGGNHDGGILQIDDGGPPPCQDGFPPARHLDPCVFEVL